MPAAYNCKTTNDIEVKIAGVLENQKLINMM